MEMTIIRNSCLAYISSFALKCIVNLDISGRIKVYGQPMPLHELARSIPIPPEKDSMLGRIMALLVHQGIFAQSEAGYLLTPISELLLVEGSNMGIYVHMLTQVDFLQSWERLSEVLTDTGTCTLFEKTFGGKQLWELSKEEPGIGNTKYYI